MNIVDRISAKIQDVPDFPKPGIVFKDITPLLADTVAFRQLIEHWQERYSGKGIDQLVAIESRGFLFGSALAYALGIGVTLVRKPGKLPRAVHEVSYALEYGEDTLQIHRDALGAGQRVVIIDDVLATGGTSRATVELVERSGAEVVELTYLMELDFLEGRARLDGRSVYSVLHY